jgi:hypothetical protein
VSSSWPPPRSRPNTSCGVRREVSASGPSLHRLGDGILPSCTGRADCRPGHPGSALPPAPEPTFILRTGLWFRSSSDPRIRRLSRGLRPRRGLPDRYRLAAGSRRDCDREPPLPRPGRRSLPCSPFVVRFASVDSIGSRGMRRWKAGEFLKENNPATTRSIRVSPYKKDSTVSTP